MANQIEKLNGIEIASIEKLNGLTDDNIEKLNGLEFTGTPADAHTFISDNSSDTTNLSDITFSSGIDSTYDVYMFDFININAATDNTTFQFQVNSTDASHTTYDDSAITVPILLRITMSLRRGQAQLCITMEVGTLPNQQVLSLLSIMLATGQMNPYRAGCGYMLHPAGLM